MQMNLKPTIRNFLTTCVLLAVTVGAAASDQTPLEIKPDRSYLVADPRLQGKQQGLAMTLHQFKRYTGNPIIVPEHPWEGKSDQRPGFIQLGGCVMYDEDEKLWKIWYAAWAERFSRNYVCYATSDDGIRWVKPQLGIHAYQGNKQNNILTVGNVGAAVYKDPAPKDPARRWIMWGKQCRPGEGGKPVDYGVYRFYSPDGVRWTREQDRPNLPYHYPQKVLGGIMGDAGNTFWLPQLGKHVAIHQTVRPATRPAAPNDRQKGRRRTFVRFASTDGLQWNQPTVAFDSDEKDFQIDPYHQFYNISIHPFGDVFLGLMWEYHVGQGTIDIGFGISTDTVTWQRPFRGKPLLPLGPEGAWDSKMIQPAAYLVEKDGMWWMYYSGDPTTHDVADNDPKNVRTSAIGLARMPVGRIVSVNAGAEGGIFETPLIRVPDGILHVNCDARGGRLEVEVVNGDGQVMQQRSAAECLTIQDDQSRAPVSWSAGPIASRFAAGSTVRLRFQLKNAKLFGFRFH